MQRLGEVLSRELFCCVCMRHHRRKHRISLLLRPYRCYSDQGLEAVAIVAIALPCAVLIGAHDIPSATWRAGLLGGYLALGLPVS